MQITYPTSEQVRQNVRAEIAWQNLTQHRLAERIGLSPASMSKRMTGRMPLTVDELIQLAQALRVPVDQLLAVRAEAQP